jgi:tetratricopeptide (TPR) repeat protein
MAGRTKSKKPGPQKTAEQLLHEAQELIYDAWEMVDRRDTIALAWQALRISPDCADAYVILAESARAPDRALELYRKGLAAGERALGKEAFERDVGHFWGMLETRPYMRARAGLAQSLWERGRYDEAITHWRDMLRLNPGDNQGIRYILASRLLYLDRDAETAAVLRQYPEATANLTWIEALLLFRAGGDNAKSRRALDVALRSNPHVPAYLFGQKRLPRRLPEYTSWGDEREAIWCAAENMKAWKTTKGAIAWLAARISAGRPTLLH